MQVSCWHEDHEQVPSWGFENPALSILLNWRVTRAEGPQFPTDIWHPWLFLSHEFSNTCVGKAAYVGERCCGPKFQLTMTWCHGLLPWRAPHCYQLVWKDKGINLGWSTSVLKGFHQPQILICLDILPQLVHWEETFRWFAINSSQCDTLKIK